MLCHNTIRKYTLALLETFNGLKVEYTIDNNGTPEYGYKNVPIRYSTREKLHLLDAVDEQNILSGNYNVLPRTSLALSVVTKNTERQTNKFNKIATSDFGDFIFNASAYDFTFDMSIMCRGMNEASMLVEQIAARFNPTYTVLVNEIPNQVTPTSVVMQLLEVGITAQEYDDVSTDIIIVDVGLMLKGNFYSPVEDMAQIKNVDMYLNFWHHSTANEYNRAKLYQYDVTDSSLQPKPDEYELISDSGVFGLILPTITNIIANDGVIGEVIDVQCEYTDYDNKLEELQFVWSATGDTIIEGSSDRITIVGSSTELIEIKCIITDIHNNSSNLFIKTITIT